MDIQEEMGPDGNVEPFKARIVAKGYTQKEGTDYEETFSPVAMLKSIRILLSITVALDYEIWQMDVKTAFLNHNLDERIYMAQPDGFVEEGQETKVCETVKQASRSWNIRFDETVKSFDFEQSIDEPCVYKLIHEGTICLLSLVFRQLFKSPKWLDPRRDQVVSLRLERVGLGIPSRPLAVNVP